jgi:nickel-dependent lactate racemase
VVELPYGRHPYALDLGARPHRVLEARARPTPRPLAALLDAALDAPIGGPSLASISAGARVTLIVSDASRAEPREAFIEAIRRRLPDVRWTIAIATGTHGPAPVASLGLPADLLAAATIINHDGHDRRELVDLGQTSAGTPVCVHRCAIETELVVATGCIRPHYFAGFGAGGKAIFPGLGEARAIRINHRLKTEPGARAGILDGNPCRADLDEAVARVPAPIFLVNGVCDPAGGVQDVVAGDVRAAFRAGAERARPWFTLRATPASVVIASDALPVTASLYQAAKIAAAATPLVAPGGMLVVVAECADGIGPLEVVNDAILRIGVLPRLPANARLVLVSAIARADLARTPIEYADSVDEVLRNTSGDVIVLPRASQLICESDS